jgi:cathepsin D
MTIYIGSNKKPFNVLLDSTTSDFWIMSSNCTIGGCSNRATLGPMDSNTFSIGGGLVQEGNDYETFTFNRGNGEVSGDVATDSVSIAGFEGVLHFGLAQQVDTNVTNSVFPGINS